MDSRDLPETVVAELTLMAGRIWGLSQALETQPLDLLDFIGQKIANYRPGFDRLTLLPVAKVEKNEDYFHFEHSTDRAGSDPDPEDEDRHTCKGSICHC